MQETEREKEDRIDDREDISLYGDDDRENRGDDDDDQRCIHHIDNVGRDEMKERNFALEK